MMSPVIHGKVNDQAYMNYQWEGVYFKYGGDRTPMVDNTITRLA